MQGRQSPMTRSRARPCPCRPLALQAQFGRRQAEADHWEDYGDLRLCDCFPVSVKTGLPWFAAGGNFQDLSGVFEAGHHRDVPSSPPKAAKLTFPMSWDPMAASRSGRSRAGRSTIMSAQDALLIVWGLALGMAVFIASPWRR